MRVLPETFNLGEAHISRSGKEVPQRHQREFNCRCKCADKFSEDERRAIFERFNGLADHTKQNLYLRGCVKKNDSKRIRRRPRKDNATKRSSYSFRVSTEVKTVNVCRNAFLSLHGISEGRLKRKVLKFDVRIDDKRGKHGKHPHIDDAFKARIRQHIERFPARESHYSRSKNEHKKYLDSSLSIAKMYRMFLSENPNLKGVITYWMYSRIFNYEYNISFGFPRSDVWETCESYAVKVKAAERDGNITDTARFISEHEDHVQSADQFNKQLKGSSVENESSNF